MGRVRVRLYRLVDDRLYFDGQTTFNGSTIFTGFRWENRIRLLQREHFINPVVYVEYEQISGADKVLKEVEGHDVESDYAVPNALARRGHNHELETKLLLSKTFQGWNIAENTLAAKNLTGGHSWEFGYAIGASRPLALKASPKRCSFCREHFIAGVEMYGALGDRYSFGLHDTSHYLAPVVAWNLPSDWTLRLSPGFGLNYNSHRFLLRWGVSREFPGSAKPLAASSEAANSDGQDSEYFGEFGSLGSCRRSASAHRTEGKLQA